MLKHSSDLTCVVFVFLPILLLLAGCALVFVVLPMVRAPSIETLTRFARRRLRDDPDIVKSALHERMLQRFAPDLYSKYSDADAPAPTPCGAEGFLMYVLFHMVRDASNSITDNIVDSRIHKVLDRLWGHDDDRD
jgi:hypothetical protein